MLVGIKDRTAREEQRHKALDENLTRIELQSLLDRYRLNTRAEEFSIEQGSP